MGSSRPAKRTCSGRHLRLLTSRVRSSNTCSASPTHLNHVWAAKMHNSAEIQILDVIYGFLFDNI